MALTAAVGGVLGLIFGHLVSGMLLAVLACLGWHLYYTLLLERWVRRGVRSDPPQGPGVWGDIFDGLYRARKRHIQRRQNLADQVARFRDSANAMPDATVVLAEHGEMQWWNTAADRLLGLRRPIDEGQRIDNLLRHPGFHAFIEAQNGRDSITVPSPIDDDVVLEIRIVPYGEHERLLLARDVTRLNRLERMRRDFVANVSHELRTPLTVIRGLAETLADDDAHGPQTQRALSLIEQQTQRMRRLVDDLLLLSRLETEQRSGEATPVDVPALLHDLTEEARALAERSEQTLIVEVDQGLLLRGEESELHSAFSNLVFNAVKYTQSGGRIRIRWYADDRGAHFAVEDNGIGIAAQHIPRLTERFYRVDGSRTASTGGTGLGLAIVKHVLQRHAGHLAVQSRPGQGSVFRCDFPNERVIRTQVAGAKTP